MMSLTLYCLLPPGPNFRDTPRLSGNFEEESNRTCHGTDGADPVGGCPEVPVVPSSIESGHNYHPKTRVCSPCRFPADENIRDLFGSLWWTDLMPINQYSTVRSVQRLANDEPFALLGVVRESSILVERYY